MANKNYIRFNNADFDDLRIEDDAQSWTLDRLNEINNGLFNPQIDNLIDLAQRLGCASSDEVLTTYISKKDRNIYMGLPRVHLNSEGKLCVFVGSKLTFPLTYEKKTKTYSTGELVFKVSPYKKEGEPDIKAINFIANIIRETDGIEEELPVSLGLLVDANSNLTDVTKALQNDTALPEKSITQLGVGGGGYPTTYKPWMLPTGCYKITSAERKQATKKDGEKFWAANGSCSPVVDGVVDPETIYALRLTSSPFNFDMITSAIEGAPIYFYVDGGYKYDDSVASIGYAVKIVDVDKNKWARFVVAAKKNCLNIKLKKTGSVLKPHELEAKKNTELGITVEEPIKELATVGTSASSLNDLPF